MHDKKNFLLIGVAGYIAPRHLKAIKEINGNLIASYDVSDSVGILDSFFPKSNFFTCFEEFSAFVDDILLDGTKIDFVSICSPNFLHIVHIKWALRKGINVICEKPLVLNIKELEEIKKYENLYNAKVFSILQLRLHPSIISLKKKIKNIKNELEVDLTYMTSRGSWYLKSWKGTESKSGGIATNIGVHFFDMLGYVFGELKNIEVHFLNNKTASGFLKYENANVKWFLSIDSNHLPKNAVKGEKLTYRSITLQGEELEFSDGFTDLHTQSYRKILDGEGFGVDENAAAISIVEKIRTTKVITKKANFHNIIKNLIE